MSYSLAASLPDLDTPSFQGLTAAELDREQATIYEHLDVLVTKVNSNIFAYRKREAMHYVCERTISQMIREAARQPPLVGVTRYVQHIQIQKAQFARDMLEMEKLQCDYWTEIQRLQARSKWTAFKKLLGCFAETMSRRACGFHETSNGAVSREK